MVHKSVLTTAQNLVLTLVTAALLAGCGGGGSASSTMPFLPMPQPSTTPSGTGTLSTATLKGSPGFVNSIGHTVYVFDADLASPGHSVCNGACAANWPPVAGLSAPKAPFANITRDDGSKQLAYAGRPLYTFTVDTAKGQTNGDGVDAFGGLWHIARPQASTTPSPTPMPTTSALPTPMPTRSGY